MSVIENKERHVKGVQYDLKPFRNGGVIAQSYAQASLLVSDTSTDVINDVCEEAGNGHASGALLLHPLLPSAFTSHSKKRPAVQITIQHATG